MQAQLVRFAERLCGRGPTEVGGLLHQTQPVPLLFSDLLLRIFGQGANVLPHHIQQLLHVLLLRPHHLEHCVLPRSLVIVPVAAIRLSARPGSFFAIGRLPGRVFFVSARFGRNALS